MENRLMRPFRHAVLLSWTASLTVFTGLGLAAQAPGAHWTTYRSDVLQVRITVPSAWLPKKTTSALVFHTPGAKEIRAGVGLLRSAAHQSVEEAAQTQISQEGPDGWTSSAARVAGLRAVKVIGSPKNDPTMKIVQYYIDTPTGPYLLQLMAPMQAWSLYSPLFAKIVASVQFTSL